jgi:hypothetical protein
LEECPQTITGIKELYPNEQFEVKEYPSDMGLGKFAYILKSENIDFLFWGDTIDEASLRIIHINNNAYQNSNIQMIGMPASEAKELIGRAGKYSVQDGNINVETDNFLYSLIFIVKDEQIVSYTILENL